MDFLPYVKHHVTAEDVAAVARVLASDRLTQGQEVQAFERDLAEVVGAGTLDSAVACSSGTAALHLAMLAMGVKPGDRVVTSPMTFCATANAILMCGGVPVFADVDPATLNIRAECVEEQILCHDPKPVGIVAVHYAGRPCDMKALRETANKHKIWLVEDACHALGARYQSEIPGHLGAPVGICYANLSCWSFHPAKHVAAGEGGAVTGPDDRILARLRGLRDHGRDREGLMQELGYNYRLDEMSAALARSQLKRLPENICRLHKLADSYAFNMPDQVREPAWSPGLSAWHLYRIGVPGGQRDALREHLAGLNIGTQLHYRPVYLHPYYVNKNLGQEGLCPNAETAWEEGLSLPMFASMQECDTRRVCGAIEGFYA